MIVGYNIEVSVEIFHHESDGTALAAPICKS